jgi:hypothetical protein
MAPQPLAAEPRALPHPPYHANHPQRALLASRHTACLGELYWQQEAARR